MDTPARRLLPVALLALCPNLFAPPVVASRLPAPAPRPIAGVIQRPLMALSMAIGSETVPTPTPTPTERARPVQGAYVREAGGDAEALLHAATVARWGEAEWAAMRQVELAEAGFNPYAVNPSSGACGLGQALPCAKMLAMIGSLDNVAGQASWMVEYVAARYGSPSVAWQHEVAAGWY